MILLDANLLVYASLREMKESARALRWVEDRFNGAARVGIPWSSLLAFVRITTNGRLFARALTLAAAVDQIQMWLRLPTVWIPEPTAQHAEILGRLLDRESRGDLVHDAHLAALAIEHGLILCSTDRDFSRFAGLRWENPLAG